MQRMENEAHLTIERIWDDPDMIELDVHVSNGYYTGETQVYTTEKEIIELRKELEGFPKTDDHRVEFSAGTRDSYAFLSLRVYAFGGRGTCAIHVCLESNVPTDFRPEEKFKIQLEMKFEPAALDRFLPQLERISHAHKSVATLKGMMA